MDPPTTTKSHRISFLTDLEGDKSYLERFVEQSEVLQWKQDDENQRKIIDFQRPHVDHFVFGGDVWDQGGHDLYCLEQLTSFRQRYPDHVHSVLGNRDVNKMRLYAELDVGKYPPLPWREQVGPPTNATKAERLQWILQNTMGSPRAFGYRKMELTERANNSEEVHDDDVVASYQSTCHPQTGALIDHIAHSQLLLRMGQVAFLHGALPLEFLASNNCTSSESSWNDLTVLMPWLPAGQTARDVGVTSVDTWIEAVNDFATREVDKFRKHGQDSVWASVGGYHHTYGGLIQYGMGFLPQRNVTDDGRYSLQPNPTIVYNRWGSKNTRDDETPRQFWNPQHTELLRDFFRRTDLRVLCTGHQPTGDMPQTIRIDMGDTEPPCWILSCDTSYSGDTIVVGEEVDDDDSSASSSSSLSARGTGAVSELILEQCNEKLVDVYFHGTLRNAQTYTSMSLLDDTAPSKFGVVGCLTDMDAGINSGGKWWVQAALHDGSFALAAAKGFDFWRKMVR